MSSMKKIKKMIIAAVLMCSAMFLVACGGDKEYKVTVKDEKGKEVSGVTVTFSGTGIESKDVTTNKKGVATFKLTKLTKKGKYIATIKYAGSKYYNAKTVKAKITIK